MRVQKMGQSTSSERRQRRNQITADATRAIESEAPVRANNIHSVLALTGGVGAAINPETVRRVRGQQMQRGGQPFTKADLVALLYALTRIDVMTAAQMTCEDLRVAIRVRLYTINAATQDDEPTVTVVEEAPDAPPAYHALAGPVPVPSAPPAAIATKM